MRIVVNYVIQIIILIITQRKLIMSLGIQDNVITHLSTRNYTENEGLMLQNFTQLHYWIIVKKHFTFWSSGVYYNPLSHLRKTRQIKKHIFRTHSAISGSHSKRKLLRHVELYYKINWQEMDKTRQYFKKLSKNMIMWHITDCQIIKLLGVFLWLNKYFQWSVENDQYVYPLKNKNVLIILSNYNKNYC